jgi:hypothetical protein
MTPPRLVELQCPACGKSTWDMDSDYTGEAMLGQDEVPRFGRTYTCRACGVTATGFRMLQGSPPAFFLQPHPMYPMDEKDFDHWVGLLREHFPDHPMLSKVGIDWYPRLPLEQMLRRWLVRTVHRACGFPYSAR